MITAGRREPIGLKPADSRDVGLPLESKTPPIHHEPDRQGSQRDVDVEREALGNPVFDFRGFQRRDVTRRDAQRCGGIPLFVAPEARLDPARVLELQARHCASPTAVSLRH